MPFLPFIQFQIFKILTFCNFVFLPFSLSKNQNVHLTINCLIFSLSFCLLVCYGVTELTLKILEILGKCILIIQPLPPLNAKVCRGVQWFFLIYLDFWDKKVTTSDYWLLHNSTCLYRLLYKYTCYLLTLFWPKS